MKFFDCTNIQSGQGYGFDLKTYQEGDPLNINFSNPKVSLGTIKICGNVLQNEFFEYSFNNSFIRLQSPKDFLKATYDQGFITIEGLSDDKKNAFNIKLVSADITPGPKKISAFQLNQYGLFSTNYFIDITKLGPIGDMIEGNYLLTPIRMSSVNDTSSFVSNILFKVKRSN